MTSAIGLPDDSAAGVRVGTNEAVRWGITDEHMPELADLFARAWHTNGDLGQIAADVTAFRRRFTDIGYCTP